MYPHAGTPAPPGGGNSPSGKPASVGLARSASAAGAWLRDARGRVLLVIVGDLVLLHRSGLAGPKVVYLAAVAVAAVAAIPAVREVFADPARIDDRRLVLTSAAIGALALLSLPVALYYHNAPTEWLRDGSVYGLLAVAPALAIDLRKSAGLRWIAWSLIASGAVATISYVAYWLTRRGYASLPSDRSGVLLPSFYLSAALLSFASARAIATARRERGTWALISLAVFAAMVVSGARTAVILLAAPTLQLGCRVTDVRSRSSSASSYWASLRSQ